VAGCGGSSAGFAARADAICLKRQRATAALAAPGNPDEALAVWERYVRLAETELRELGALRPPAGGEATLRGLIAEIREQLAAAGRLRIASLTSDIEAAQGAFYQGRKAARRARRLALRLGLKVCAKT
jgi:hypothetical protein